ncbi:CHAP domain-containing protein [Staphylococcus lutrae]|uniref:CHAP domain-containing protein n=1 Tax=Staphylococcus lutrae TaxID=155085 RepID=A0AAC9RVC9_9STAP|nr:CHAP domain-containing protein [Staphylococcus lutrae]ARJ50452.1 CHAP domain-containing protein [Staphylococcus lutrae]PNZ38181.1 CHAP domain-containing protein [Staphylococcus lutrae]
MLKTIATTTLTAGLGAALVGLDHQQADAAENSYHYTYSYQYNTNTQGSSNYSYQSQSNQTYTNGTNTTHTSTSTQSTGVVSAGNLYTAGQCTWYVYDKVGGKVGSTWGNANNWAQAAAAAGYTVNHTPQAGAILQSSEGPFGHVAYVEAVHSDGSIEISEMNYNGGPFSISSRTLPASEAASYFYIHL